ncbi:MAG TPA: hypothetical protein VMI52_08800 [Acetobacteraceae bacterium]|nr:hypothetical protein [Acetobacteraceae bacterium]
MQGGRPTAASRPAAGMEVPTAPSPPPPVAAAARGRDKGALEKANDETRVHPYDIGVRRIMTLA